MAKGPALRHPSQGQHVEADVTHPHRLVQIELDDGNLFHGALVTQQATAVPAEGETREKEPAC